MIIVHQMAKVASMAWVEAARPAARLIQDVPQHTHFLTESNLSRLAEILATPAPDNTIVNSLVVRSMHRNGRRTRGRIDAARETGHEIRVITGIRDPVARSISLLSFFADFCGHSGRSLSARDGASADDVCAALVALWRMVLSGISPSNSFERLVWHMMGIYRTWFGDELQTVFGVDAIAEPFTGGAQYLHGPGVRILLYRAEDLLPGSPAREVLHDLARTFLGTPDASLLEVNTAATRRSYPLYLETRRRFHLPIAMLNVIYDEPVIKHFYSESDISAFKVRWQSPDC